MIKKILLVILVIAVGYFLFTKVTNSTLRCNGITMGIMSLLPGGHDIPFTRYDVDSCISKEADGRQSKELCTLIEGELNRGQCDCSFVEDKDRREECYNNVIDTYPSTSP